MMGGPGIKCKQFSALTEERDKIRTKIRDKAKVHRNKCKMLIGHRGVSQVDDTESCKRVRYKTIWLRGVKEMKCTWWTLVLTIVCFTSAVNCFPPPLTPRPTVQHQVYSSPNIQDALYNSFSAALAQQGLQSILTSIEDRLRDLDGIMTRTRGGIDAQLYQTNRKIEDLETKLVHLESVVGSRLESLSARLDYIVPRLERHGERSLAALLAADRSAKACEGLNHRFDKQSEVANAEGASHWRGVVTNAGGDKSGGRGVATPNLGASHPPAHAWGRNLSVAQQEQPSQIEVRLRKLEEAAINPGRRPQLMQQDASSAGELRAVLANETAMIATKISSMYYELWRRSHSMEAMVKDAMALTNATRRETQDGLRSLMLQLTRRGLLPPQPTHTPTSQMHNLNNLTSIIQRKMTETNRKMDTKLDAILLAQNLFLDSCHKIQLNEPQMEQHITIVLEKLVDTFMNRTTITLNEIQLIQGLVKSHDSSIKSAVARVNNAALMSGKHSKSIINSLDEFKEEYKDIIDNRNRGIGDEAGKLFGMKVDGMTTILQEIQEQITYTEKQHEYAKTNNNQIILDSISVEIYKAVKNFTLSSQLTNNACPANKLQEQMIEKLMHLSENLQNSIDNLDFSEDYVTDSGADQFNDERNMKRIPNNITNITNPVELIDRLNQINFEDSSEDVENMQNEVNARGKNTKHIEGIVHQNARTKTNIDPFNRNNNVKVTETENRDVDKYIHNNYKHHDHRFLGKKDHRADLPNLEEDSYKYAEREVESYKKNETNFGYRDDFDYDDEIQNDPLEEIHLP